MGITTGPDGNLWFTEQTSDEIGRITPSGTITHGIGLALMFRVIPPPDGLILQVRFGSPAQRRERQDAAADKHDVRPLARLGSGWRWRRGATRRRSTAPR